MAVEEPQGQLNPDSILIAEFEYITQAAFQVSEDRAKVSNFYLVTVGSFVAAVLGAQLDNADPQLVFTVFGILFVVLTLNGLVTLLHLVQLRHAWLDSVTAMNHIKDFYAQHHPDQDLVHAFRWRTLPSSFKMWSVSFLLALQVAVLGGVTLGTAVALFGASSGERWIDSGLLIGVFYFFAQLVIFWLLLREKRAA